MDQLENDFPTKLTSDRAIIERDYFVLSDTRSADSRLHYQVTIPKTWKMLDTAPATLSESKPIATQGVIRSTVGPEAELEIEAAHLPREIAPADWLAILLEGLEHEILHSRLTTSAGGDLPDVMSKSVFEGRTIIHRWVAIKNGSFLFLAQARCYEEDYSNFPETFMLATASIEFLNPIEWPLSEQLQTFSRAEPADFLLVYPESWQLQLDPNSGEEGLSLNLLSVMDDYVVGTIIFVVIPSTDIGVITLRDRIWEDLQNNDYSGSLSDLENASATPGLPDRAELVSQVQRRGVAHEIRMSTGTAEGATYLVAVAGPARETDSQVWAINKRAYQLVINQLRTIPGAE